MLALSGTTMWLPLYALILWLVWRRTGWRGLAVFTAAMIAALALSDMVSGIFKHNGLLGGLLPGFEPRPRPMFTPSLEGLAITPDSLHALRRMTPDALAAAGYAGDWAVHVPPEAVSGRYGTVSAHAATIVALAVLSAPAVRRRWFTLLMVLCTAAICYSRIYLGKHPADGPRVGVARGRRAGSGGLRHLPAVWRERSGGIIAILPFFRYLCGVESENDKNTEIWQSNSANRNSCAGSRSRRCATWASSPTPPRATR